MRRGPWLPFCRGHRLPRACPASRLCGRSKIAAALVYKPCRVSLSCNGGLLLSEEAPCPHVPAECMEWTGGQIKNNDSAEDVKNVDLTCVRAPWPSACGPPPLALQHSVALRSPTGRYKARGSLSAARGTRGGAASRLGMMWRPGQPRVLWWAAMPGCTNTCAGQPLPHQHTPEDLAGRSSVALNYLFKLVRLAPLPLQCCACAARRRAQLWDLAASDVMLAPVRRKKAWDFFWRVSHVSEE